MLFIVVAFLAVKLVTDAVQAFRLLASVSVDLYLLSISLFMVLHLFSVGGTFDSMFLVEVGPQ